MRPTLLLLFAAGCAVAEIAYRLPAATYGRAVEYNRALDWLYFIGAGAELLVLAAMVRWRFGPWLRDRAGWLSLPAVPIALRLCVLPLSLYRHTIALRYQQSVEPWLPWLGDWAKQTALEALIVSLAALLLAALARRWRRWWVAAWVASIPIAVFAAFLFPLIVEPLFYTFEPLERTRPELVTDVEAVADRAGYPVPPDRVLLMRASEKVRSVNAYMTGFGPTRRIVIWDTTVAALTPSQIQSVFAHELGHYALDHIPKSIALGSLLLLGLLFAGDRLGNRLIARHGERWRIRGLADRGALPLLLAIFVLFDFLSTPLVNGYSRWQERQADIYELTTMSALVREPGLVSAQVDQVMGEIDLENPQPSPFVVFWLYTHPPIADRMHFAQSYLARPR